MRHWQSTTICRILFEDEFYGNKPVLPTTRRCVHYLTLLSHLHYFINRGLHFEGYTRENVTRNTNKYEHSIWYNVYQLLTALLPSRLLWFWNKEKHTHIVQNLGFPQLQWDVFSIGGIVGDTSSRQMTISRRTPFTVWPFHGIPSADMLDHHWWEYMSWNRSYYNYPFASVSYVDQ